MEMKTLSEHWQSIKNILSPLSAFFAGTFIMYIANGLNASILAIRLTDNGVPTFYTGLILSLYYLAYIVSTQTSSFIINRVGQVRAFTTYISVLSSLVLIHSLSPSPLLWAVLRFGEGYCLAAALMCVESWLNTRSTNKNRGTIMSVYMVMTYCGMATGQLLLNIPDKSGFLIFILVSVFYSWALVPVSLTGQPSAEIKKHESMSLKRIYKLAPMSMIGCIISGVLVGNVYTLGPIYAQKIGLNMQNTSLFMFFCIVGGMLAQIPLGRLSDRMDRRFVMMWLCGGLFLVAPWMHFLIDANILFLAICAMLLGTGTFVLYPICISHLNDKITDDERIEASGMLILLQSIGMMSGPVIISLAMQWWGAICFVMAFSFFSGIFVLFAFKNIVFRPTGYIASGKTDPIPASQTHVFTNISQHDSLLDRAKDLFTEKKH